MFALFQMRELAANRCLDQIFHAGLHVCVSEQAERSVFGTKWTKLDETQSGRFKPRALRRA